MLLADSACSARATAFDQEGIDMANMNAAESNAALIISGYEAFSRGDIQSALAVFAEDISWHVPGRGPLSRDYRGHTEVLGFFDHFMRLSDGTFRLQIDEALAKGERVVILCTETRTARQSKLVFSAGSRVDGKGWPRHNLPGIRGRSAGRRRVLVDAHLSRLPHLLITRALR
jgi:ketosteroid isomerase-like protein